MMYSFLRTLAVIEFILVEVQAKSATKAMPVVKIPILLGFPTDGSLSFG